MDTHFKLAIKNLRDAETMAYKAMVSAFPKGCVVAWTKGNLHGKATNLARVIGYKAPHTLLCQYGPPQWAQGAMHGGKASVDASKVLEIVSAS